MQVAAGDVQRQLGAIQNALEHEQVLGDDFLDVVRHEDLVVVELDLALHGLVLVAQAGEVQDTLEVEGVIGVDVETRRPAAWL